MTTMPAVNIQEVKKNSVNLNNMEIKGIRINSPLSKHLLHSTRLLTGMWTNLITPRGQFVKVHVFDETKFSLVLFLFQTYTTS